MTTSRRRWRNVHELPALAWLKAWWTCQLRDHNWDGPFLPPFFNYVCTRCGRRVLVISREAQKRRGRRGEGA